MMLFALNEMSSIDAPVPPDSRSDIFASRSFLLNKNRLWPNALVPYVIDPEFSGCKSYIGRTGGHQPIWLQPECFLLKGYKGSVLHETMHALGFIHEHQRPDRDCYVDVDHRVKYGWNMKPMKNVDSRFPYDFRSIMHYRSNLKGWKGEQLNNRKGTLTQMDKMKLNFLYCGAPHFCDMYPLECKRIQEKEKNCIV